MTVMSTGDLTAPTPWFENSLSGIVTVILHLVVLIILAIVPWGNLYDGQWGDGEDIVLGKMPVQNLLEDSVETLEFENIDKMQTDSLEMLTNEVNPPSASDDLADIQLDVNLLAPSGGVSQSIDLQAFSKPKIEASGSEDFGELISRLKKNGLDIVIAFDSTASMQGEINQVKSRIERMGKTLLELVPKTRISICVYRDLEDEYVAKGIPLTDNIAKILEFLESVKAAGGGDQPEAVDAGLDWSMSRNDFRRSARKIILLFGDAPPHNDKKNLTLKLASDFRRKQQGIVSTVTCKNDGKRILEFVEIAQMGGGESFLVRDEREIMTQLMILVFGSRHKNKVLKAFDLMER